MHLTNMFNGNRKKTEEELAAERIKSPNSQYISTTIYEPKVGTWCQKCWEKFPKTPNNSYKNTRNAAASPAEQALIQRGLLQKQKIFKTEERKEWEKVLIDHAVKAHGFKHCERCGEFVRNLKQHQKTFGCQEKERTNCFEEAGWQLVEIPYKCFLEYIDLAKQKEMNELPWDDRNKWKDIEKAYHQFKFDLLEKAFIELAPTGRSKQLNYNNETAGWIWQAWAPDLTAQCFNHLYQRHCTALSKKLEFDVVAELRAWLDLDETQRENALGGWDLATDEVK